MNINYSQFYRGTTDITSYGNSAYKKDTLVKYEFNTTDENGNKVMDKMSREETLQAMKDISSQYEDGVIVEFSGDGMAALVESRKGVVDDSITQEQRDAIENRNKEFHKEITQIDNSIDLTTDNVTKKDSNQNYSSNLKTTNALDMMKTMDSDAYTKYQKISKESSNEDRQLNELKYITNWYAGAVKKNPSMVDDYEKQKEADSKSEKEANSKDEPATKAEKCTTNTDNVDKEIEKLKMKKQQLEQQVNAVAGDENRMKELKQRLNQVEIELNQKDNDTYRRQQAEIY